jgi:SAM-dependent methyltransferase
MSNDVPGTEGYAENAAKMVERWESMSFYDLHGDVANLLPHGPVDVLDIGAGSGRDAAVLAGMGHRVVAVEPLDEFRAIGAARHESKRIVWVDDSLPELDVIRSMNRAFDIIMLTAVWMHLDASERPRAMRTVSSLLRAKGLMLMTLRHGPIPQGRHMFDVTAEETVQLATACGLRLVLSLRRESIQEANRENGVVWTRFAFARG